MEKIEDSRISMHRYASYNQQQPILQGNEKEEEEIEKGEIR